MKNPNKSNILIPDATSLSGLVGSSIRSPLRSIWSVFFFKGIHASFNFANKYSLINVTMYRRIYIIPYYKQTPFPFY